MKIFAAILVLLPCLSFSTPLIIGHRGARALKPENTLPGYKYALDIGVDIVDMDINMTQDGILVVTHNPSLNPDITQNKQGNFIKSPNHLVKHISYSTLQNYTVGVINHESQYAKLFPQQSAIASLHIPMLKEVIEYVEKNKPSAMYQIEIKHNPLKPQETYSCKKIATALNAVLEAENISQQTIVQSFDFECLEALQSLNPLAKTAYLTSSESEKIIFSSDKKLSLLLTNGHPVSYYHNSLPKLVAALHGYAWDPEESELTPQQLMQAHQLGLKVMTWTSPKNASDVFNKERVLQLIDLGVDGIITDRPDLLIQSI